MKQMNVKFYNNNIHNFNSMTLAKIKSYNTTTFPHERGGDARRLA